jgi:signal peptidase I
VRRLHSIVPAYAPPGLSLKANVLNDNKTEMSLYFSLRHTLKLRHAIQSCNRQSSFATAGNYNIGRKKIKKFSISSPFSTSDVYFLSLPSRLTPCVSDIARTLSNKTAEAKPPTPSDPPSFLRNLSDETHLLLQYLHDFFFYDLPVLLPRAIAFVATLQLTTEYGFQTVSCEGPSMEPTIIDGSYSCVFIERWSHRLFGLEKDDDHAAEMNEGESSIVGGNDSEYSWWALLHGVWEQHFASGLQHGDVIILHHPSKEATICKRIIGMPGDTIVRTDLDDEESSHRVVPPGHLWIEGDNSNNSLDSRSYGTVPASLVIGKVVCRLWPLRDYITLEIDANGTEQRKRVNARIGRGERPVSVTGSQSNTGHGSYALTNCKTVKNR